MKSENIKKFRVEMKSENIKKSRAEMKSENIKKYRTEIKSENMKKSPAEMKSENIKKLRVKMNSENIKKFRAEIKSENIKKSRAQMKSENTKKISGGNKFREHISNIRRSRSVPGIANPAIKAFIKSAVEVPTTSQKYRKFMKEGNRQDAIADFNKLKPTNVLQKRLTTGGFVGDAKLLLKLNPGRRPNILIFDPKSDSSVKIVYFKDRPWYLCRHLKAQ